MPRFMVFLVFHLSNRGIHCFCIKSLILDFRAHLNSCFNLEQKKILYQWNRLVDKIGNHDLEVISDTRISGLIQTKIQTDK
jgi:hypothetical protein